MRTTIVNPFFTARLNRSPQLPGRGNPPTYAKLPQAPVNASPVPHLTSLYHFSRAGEYGDRSYPGNCGGNLIKDLLRYFQPTSVFDPMTGSGTCRDVCEELEIYCWSSDLRQNVDACDPSQFPRACFEFAWIHPPYWRQKLYCDDPRDISRTPTLDAFLERYRLLIANCAAPSCPPARLPFSWAIIATARPASCRLPITRSSLPSPAGCGSAVPTLSGSATAPAAAARYIARPSSPACTTRA